MGKKHENSELTSKSEDRSSYSSRHRAVSASTEVGATCVVLAAVGSSHVQEISSDSGVQDGVDK